MLFPPLLKRTTLCPPLYGITVQDLRVNVIYNVETVEENILNEVIRLIKGIYIFVYVILV